MDEWIIFKGQEDFKQVETSIKEATHKQIKLLNKLLDSRKITDKMFNMAIKDKSFANKVIKQGLTFNPLNRFGGN